MSSISKMATKINITEIKTFTNGKDRKQTRLGTLLYHQLLPVLCITPGLKKKKNLFFEEVLAELLAIYTDG